MYSIDNTISPEKLQKTVSCLAIQPKADWNGPTISIGRDYQGWQHRPQNLGDGRTLLFMAGMWEKTKARVDHVLETRGLSVLLQAGRFLAPRGIKLHIAAPLLEDEQCRRYLLQHPSNTWPSEQIILHAAVKVPDIYHLADLFVFPYQGDINQFVPTSVIEAMAAGIPVALSDLPCLRPLASDGETAWLFPPSDVRKLSETILEALTPGDQRTQTIERAHHYALTNWSIQRSAEDLRRLAATLVSARTAPHIQALE